MCVWSLARSHSDRGRGPKRERMVECTDLLAHVFDRGRWLDEVWGESPSMPVLHLQTLFRKTKIFTARMMVARLCLLACRPLCGCTVH
jgi:hypothetical protein